ncbi:MAG: hypothetical protein M3O32_15575 [Actinomycetota bacterium]|nr:hypothetical protein [Actinomycetota bacterium]
MEHLYATYGDFLAGHHRVVRHGRGSFRRFPDAAAHRIHSLRPRTVTLVLVGRRRSSWSFWTHSGPVDWRDYDDGMVRPPAVAL